MQPKKEKCPALDRACGGAYQECAKNPEVRKIWVVLETNRIEWLQSKEQAGEGQTINSTSEPPLRLK